MRNMLTRIVYVYLGDNQYRVNLDSEVVLIKKMKWDGTFRWLRVYARGTISNALIRGSDKWYAEHPESER